LLLTTVDEVFVEFQNHTFYRGHSAAVSLAPEKQYITVQFLIFFFYFFLFFFAVEVRENGQNFTPLQRKRPVLLGNYSFIFAKKCIQTFFFIMWKPHQSTLCWYHAQLQCSWQNVTSTSMLHNFKNLCLFSRATGKIMLKMSEQRIGLLRKLRKKSWRLHILQDDYTTSKHCLSQHVKQGETTDTNSEVWGKKYSQRCSNMFWKNPLVFWREQWWQDQNTTCF